MIVPVIFRTCAVSMIAFLALTTAAKAQQSAGSTEAANLPNDGEIVVTARRREENVQSVPTAISVFSGARLQQLGVSRPADLKTITAGLNIQGSAGREDSPIYLIRGQRATDATLTQDGAVALYVDDVLIGASQGSNLGLFDLASVQVLKGPQGTLFGRNTTGGAVLFTAARPTDRLEAGVTVGLGNYSQQLVEAFINVPLSDTLRIRGALQYNHHRGFTKIVDGARRGQRLQDRDELNGRFTAEFAPTDGMKSTTVFYASRSDSTGPGLFFQGFNPASAAAFVPGIAGALADQQKRSDRETAAEYPDTGSRARVWGTYNTTSINLGDDVTFKNIVSYRHVNFHARDDFDGTALAILETDNTYNSRQVTEEAQILGRALDGKIDYVLGIYYFEMHGLGTTNESHALEPINPGSPNFVGGPFRNKSFSGYGQITWKTPIEGVSATGGVRYTVDQRSITVSPQTLPSAPSGAACNLSQPGMVYTLANCSRNESTSFTSPTWTVSIDYKIDPDTLLYVAHRHGYRSGGYNARALTDAQFAPFKPEYVNDLELGFKRVSMISGWRIRTNLAGYYQWYNNIQRNVNFITAGTLQTGIINAASARIYGGEAELSIEPTRRLRIDLNYSYTRPKYTSFLVVDSRNGVPNQVVDQSGADFSFVPRHQFNASVHYEYSLADRGALAFTANYSYQSSESFAELYQSVAALRSRYTPAAAAQISSDLPGFGQKGYGLLGLRLDWSDKSNHPIMISVIAKNVTNKSYLASGLPLYDSLGASSAVRGDPRTVMGQVSVKF